MKVTNLEISKKLKELGFVAETDYGWGIDLNGNYYCNHYEQGGRRDIKAFDLEIIIKALPKKIKFRGDDYRLWMTYSTSSDCWIVGYISGHVRRTELEVYSVEDGSLADCAGALLILLIKEGIIKQDKN